MIEIRMLHRSHDEYHGEHGYPTKFTEDILQYRQCPDVSYPLPEGVSVNWSEWIDVPDVYEEEGE